MTASQRAALTESPAQATSPVSRIVEWQRHVNAFLINLCVCMTMADHARPHLNIVTGVEGLQVKLLPGLGGPQAQVDCVVGLEPWDGVVVGDSRHLHVT